MKLIRSIILNSYISQDKKFWLIGRKANDYFVYPRLNIPISLRAFHTRKSYNDRKTIELATKNVVRGGVREKRRNEKRRNKADNINSNWSMDRMQSHWRIDTRIFTW